MISYILEILVFQLVFLLVYDLLLKHETFFHWNRVYLLATFALSLFLPWIKIEALKTSIAQDAFFYSSFLYQLDEVSVRATDEATSFLKSIPFEYLIIATGSLIMLFWFIFKLHKIYVLKTKGTIQRYTDFTKVSIQNSEAAFSFFKHVFLGNKIPPKREQQIIAHELVHIRQWHSLDLLFFELMRIVFWFNPLVYVYQNRIAELHEFVADHCTAKTNKKGQCQQLLSEAFNTQNISFVNQFYKKSLIKKRIVMLQRQKSKTIFKLKYLALAPLLFAMLLFSSCEVKTNEDETQVETKASINLVVPFSKVNEVPIFPGCEEEEDKMACFQEKIVRHVQKNFNYPKEAEEQGIEGRVSVLFTIDTEGQITDINKRGPHELLEDEVDRIIKRLPKMQAGRHEGKAVNVPFSLPIVFKLN